MTPHTSTARRAGGAALALVALAVAAHWPALGGGFLWDDDDYITENGTLRSVAGLWRIWSELGAVPQYYPLVHTTFWVEYHLYGLHATGYHIVNVLLHASSAVVLWRLAAHLRLPAAWLLAALFAVHPVHVESVAWITERKNVLSGLLYLIAATLYLRLPRAGPLPKGRYALFLLAFTGALLAKTVTVSLPAALLVVLWWQSGRVARRDVLQLLPTLAIGIPLALVTSWMEVHVVGASGPAWDLSLAERTLIAGRAVCFYAGKLVWPTDLMFIYPRWQIDTASLGPWAFPAAAAAVPLLLLAFRRRLSRGPLAAVLLFGGTLFPALGYFDVYPMRFSFVADHFQYHASLGLLALLASALHRLARPAPPAALLVVLLLALSSWHRSQSFRSLERLWRDTLAVNPAAQIAHTNLGTLLLDRGDVGAAMEHFQAGLRLDPSDPLVHYNLGVARTQLGQPEKALAHFEQALRLQPDYPDALLNYGQLLADAGRGAEAIPLFQAALAESPDDATLHVGRGLLLGRLGQTEAALTAYRQALRHRPQDPVAHTNLGIALLGTDAEAAVEHFRAAVAARPNDGALQLNLGNALIQLGRDGAAIPHLRAALAATPGQATVHYFLGRCLQRTGDSGGARQQFEAALRIDPSLDAAKRALGR